MISFFPLKQNINNGILTGMNRMPAKDGPSSGGSFFSMNRSIYTKAPSFLQKSQLTKTEVDQKKWFGTSTNRDSSRIIKDKKTSHIGVSSKVGVDNTISFTSHKDVNDSRQARSRTRSGGSVVPMKTRYRGMDSSPIF